MAAKRKVNAPEVWSPLALQVDADLADVMAEAVASLERHSKGAAKVARASRTRTPKPPVPDVEDLSDADTAELGMEEVTLGPSPDAGQATGQVSPVEPAADERDGLIEHLSAMIETLEHQRAGLDLLNDKLQGQLEEIEREMEQMHRRSLREREQALKSGQEITIREFLPAMDNLDRARAYVAADPTQVVQGFVMVADQFRRAFTRLGAERIDASSGTTFDPDRHEAILQVHRDDLPPGSVVEEARSGWMLNGRLLRAAQVAVVAGPSVAPPVAEPVAAARVPESTAPVAAAPEDDAAQPSTPASTRDRPPEDAPPS